MTKPRHRPYTARGITRVPCSRCGAPSVHQWQICADGNQYRGCCAECDVELNRMVLEFMRIPDAAAKLAAYRGVPKPEAPEFMRPGFKGCAFPAGTIPLPREDDGQPLTDRPGPRGFQEY